MEIEIVEVAYADTPEICGVMRLPWRTGGWAVLVCRLPDGSKMSLIGADLEYLRLIEAGAGLREVDIPHNKFPIRRDGWPDDWPAAKELT